MAQRGERSDTHSCGVGAHPKRNDWCSYGCRGALHRQPSWLRALTRCVRSACDTGGMLSTPRVGGWAGDVRVLVNEAELKPASGPGLRASHPRAGRVSHGGGQRAGHRRGRRPPAPARPAGLAALDSGVAVPRAAALCSRRPPVARVVAGSAADNRVIDWLQFLTYVAARVPRGYWVHVIADNAVTHQHPAVPAWLARHPQVVVHLVSRDRPLPRWFLRVLQQWVRPHLPPPPPPVPQTLPKWLVRLLQERGTLRLPRNRLAEITSLRAAIGVLRPRSVRRRSPSFWMASKPFVRCCGNPRWGLPPDP